ncbi:MAG: polysaccharide deacetylase family protein [Pirellulaceae bacterium]|nr:polysaccharide deacetylase family protein [Pirellulaceae bacterium]
MARRTIAGSNPPRGPATLLVTIDTEEEGLWGGTYRRTNNTVRNIQGLPRFQELCDGLGIRPTYLIDAPVVSDAAAVGLLRPLQDDGRAEIGAHVHPWCNPPLEEESSARNSYLCNLSAALQRRKISWLTEQIEHQFGRRPTSFRAGRYGLDISGARILADLGYQVDSSVIPFIDYTSEGGPDFRHAPYDPYYIDGNDLCQPHAAGRLLEVPVTLGYSRPQFRQADALRRWAERTPWRQLRCVGILDRLGMARRIKLSPEQASVAEMRQLVDARLRQGASCLVLMFHSSSLLPGCSPYVPDERALDEFYRRLTGLFEYCLGERQCAACTLSEFAQAHSAAAARPAATPFA